jgi:hypothetical protein
MSFRQTLKTPALFGKLLHKCELRSAQWTRFSVSYTPQQFAAGSSLFEPTQYVPSWVSLCPLNKKQSSSFISLRQVAPLWVTRDIRSTGAFSFNSYINFAKASMSPCYWFATRHDQTIALKLYYIKCRHQNCTVTLVQCVEHRGTRFQSRVLSVAAYSDQ